jgi:hypothetical protein
MRMGLRGLSIMTSSADLTGGWYALGVCDGWGPILLFVVQILSGNVLRVCDDLLATP